MDKRSDKAVRLSKFAQRLLSGWNRCGWHRECERFILAVSGGADSVALLLAFDELHKAKRLTDKMFVVAHLDHGLRGESGADDARWVKNLSRTLGYECISRRASVGENARECRDNLEQAARRARYEFLGETARQQGACAVLTAHTLDDQAETVLLRLVRGSGAEGLGGMRASRALDTAGGVLLWRPLLDWARRADTEEYCCARGVEFRQDEMNQDERLARVYVRRKILPLLETLNPRAVEAIGRAAGLLREDASSLDALATELLKEASVVEVSVQTDEDGVTDGASANTNNGADEGQVANKENAVPRPLRVVMLTGAPAALRRRALRKWIACGRGDLRRLELAHVSAVEKLLDGERGGRVIELPGGCFVERRRELLHFRRKLS